MEFLNNRGPVICYLMVLLAGFLSIAGAFLSLKVTDINGVIAAIGLCLIVASHYKEEP